MFASSPIMDIHWDNIQLEHLHIKMHDSSGYFQKHSKKLQYAYQSDVFPFLEACMDLGLRLYIEMYSWLLLSQLHLSWITAYLLVKIWKSNNRSQNRLQNINSYKILRKIGEIAPRSNFFSFPQYFYYISNFRSQITYSFVNCCYSIYFSSILQIWYVEVQIQISQNISESPLDFQITRVNCI